MVTVRSGRESHCYNLYGDSDDDVDESDGRWNGDERQLLDNEIASLPTVIRLNVYMMIHRLVGVSLSSVNEP
jgi:hypothetical protein